MSLDEHTDPQDDQGGLGNSVNFPGFTVNDTHHNDPQKKVTKIKYKMKYQTDDGQGHTTETWSGNPAGSELEINPNPAAANTWVNNPNPGAGQVTEIVVDLEYADNASCDSTESATAGHAASSASYTVQPNRTMNANIVWSPWTPGP